MVVGVAVGGDHLMDFECPVDYVNVYIGRDIGIDRDINAYLGSMLPLSPEMASSQLETSVCS